MIIDKVEKYCIHILNKGNCNQLPFHNLEHTLEVVANVKLISQELDLSQKDIELLQIAAWFHDTGFSVAYKGHEEASKKIARGFLSWIGIEKKITDNICTCIDATKMPQNPVTKLAEVLCDADIFHISTEHFFYRKVLLRREWEIFCDLKMTDKEWHQLNLKFLENCHFSTQYGQNILEKGKERNIKRVKEIIAYY